MNEFGRLLLNCGHDFGMAMPRGDDSNSCSKDVYKRQMLSLPPSTPMDAVIVFGSATILFADIAIQ